MNNHRYHSSSFRHLASSAFFQPLGLGLIFVLHFLLARELGAEDFGVVSFVLTAAPVAAVILCMGFPVAALKFVPQYMVSGKMAEARGYLLWSLLWVLSTAILFSISLFLIAQFVSTSETKNLLYLLIFSTFPVVVWMWQRNASLAFNFVTQALLPRDVLFPVLAILMVFLLNIETAKEAIVVINLAYIVGLAVGLIWLYRSIPTEVKSPEAIVFRIKKWFRTSSNMVMSALMHFGMNGWDILLLGMLVSMEETGIYAVAARLSLLISTIIRVLVTASSQRFSALYAENSITRIKRLIKRLNLLSAAVGVTLFLIIIAFARPLLGYFGDAYLDALTLLWVLAVGQLVNALVGPVVGILNMMEEERFVARSLLFWSAISLILNYILISEYAALGAAIASSVTVVALNIHQYWYLQKKVIKMDEQGQERRHAEAVHE